MVMLDNDNVLQTAFCDSETRQVGSQNNWVNRGMENVRMPNTYIKIAHVLAAVGWHSWKLDRDHSYFKEYNDAQDVY